ncbi:hypothetical protein [Ensifer sp. MJa1]|uniref:hypothetical protein n=1 Tax=Ensifer sp. MJa1 TaxID=2919888 RepID=UPI00300BE68E
MNFDFTDLPALEPNRRPSAFIAPQPITPASQVSASRPAEAVPVGNFDVLSHHRKAN